MTDEIEIEFKDQAGRRWTSPIPPQVRIRLDAHEALVQLKAALAQLKNAIEGCHVARENMEFDSDAAMILLDWEAVCERLKNRWEPVSTASHALAEAVLKLLLD